MPGNAARKVPVKVRQRAYINTQAYFNDALCDLQTNLQFITTLPALATGMHSYSHRHGAGPHSFLKFMDL